MTKEKISKDECKSCSIYGQICAECQKYLTGEIDAGFVQKNVDVGGVRKQIKKKVNILSKLDVGISVLVVTPLVVACWRGTWQLMDIYSDYFPPWESFIVGTTIQIVTGMAQESFHDVINKEHKSLPSKVFASVFMKLYTLVLNVVTNLHWRGVWIIIDRYLVVVVDENGTNVKQGRAALVFFGLCFLIMFVMRCLRNMNSPPFGICLDYGEDMFLFPTMFNVKASEKLSLFVLDIAFSVGVVTNLGIAVWRGLWLVIDVYFFPEDFRLSSWASLVLGYVMVSIVFVLQPMMKKLCDNLNGISKLLVADAYMMLAVMAVIVVWRGIWNLINIYFLPNNEELSCWITHWVPMIILMIMGCSNSVLVRGVCLDCREPDGTCVVFPCNYLKVIFDQEQNDTWLSILMGNSKNTWSLTPIESKPPLEVDYHVVTMTDKIDIKNEFP